MSFNKILIELRKKNGLSQEQLGLKIGVSRQSISKWETGLSQPELLNIEKLCEVFGVTPNELMGYNLKKERNKTKKYIIIFVLFIVVLGLYILTQHKEEYYGFYVNDLRMNLIETNDEYQSYNISFIPSVYNQDYIYSIVIVDNKGFNQKFEANIEYNICTSKINLKKNEEVTIYAQIQSKDIIFSCPLMKVWAMKEE